MNTPTCAAVEHTVYRLTREPGRLDLGRSRSVKLLITAEKTSAGWRKHSVQTTGLAGVSWSWFHDMKPEERVAIETALDEQFLRDQGSDIPAIARREAGIECTGGGA